VSAIAAYWLRHDTLDMPFYYQAAIALGAILTVNFTQLAGVYRHSVLEHVPSQILHALVAWAGVLTTLLIMAYFTRTSEWFSRAWVAIWMALAAAGFVAIRLAALLQLWRLRLRGDLSTHVAIVGARELGRAVIRQLREDRVEDVRIVGVFDDAGPLPGELEGCPVRGSTDDLIEVARRERIDEVILAMVDRSEAEIEQVVAKLRPLPLNTKLCAHSLRLNLPVHGFTAFAGLPLLHVFERPLSGWGGVWKTLEDRVLGAVILILMLPLMAVCALLIKLDSAGPALFRQKRYGFNNNEITVFKFRTMAHEPQADASVPQARRNDPRITRIGAFLRKTSLDELPQLFNVLRGEMSLVGPRPHAVAHNEHYAKIIDGYLGRHRVKPGITGWAQVNGLRGETETPEKMRMRVQYDLFYIDNWSLLFDLKILAMTSFLGFVHRNAY
ncbi:MAG: undecaprenyl-phosphate glucose phosphotransferase, partial [Alphaproteobacteria bacterium]|nr:undecaprenyl-phosphate glucose phosphotransferase [Alphaproteobacteria bacterium]